MGDILNNKWVPTSGFIYWLVEKYRVYKKFFRSHGMYKKELPNEIPDDLTLSREIDSKLGRKIKAIKDINSSLYWFYAVINPARHNYSNLSLPVPLSDAALNKMKLNYENQSGYFSKNEIAQLRYYNVGKLVKTNQKFRNMLLHILNIKESELGLKQSEFDAQCETFMKNVFNVVFYIVKFVAYRPMGIPSFINYLLSTVYFTTQRDIFKSRYKSEQVYKKKILVLLTLTLEAVFYILNENISKAIALELPKILLKKYLGNSYDVITFGLQKSSENLRNFVSLNILNRNTIKYYDKLTGLIYSKYQLLLFPHTDKLTGSTKNVLHRNILRINKSLERVLQPHADAPGNRKQLVANLLVVVGDVLLPVSNINTVKTSRKFSNRNNIVNLTPLAGHNTSRFTWYLWDKLLYCIDYLNNG